MSTLIKTPLIAALAAGLLVITAHAGSQSYVTTGTTTATVHGFGNSWNITTPAQTDVTTSVTLTLPPGVPGGLGGSASVQGPNIYVQSYVGTATPGTFHDSDSNYWGNAGNYTIVHSFGSPGVGASGTLTSTLYW